MEAAYAVFGSKTVLADPQYNSISFNNQGYHKYCYKVPDTISCICQY